MEPSFTESAQDGPLASTQRDLQLSLAGFQAGSLGALLMIGWWLLGELLKRRSAWIIPNLLATTFYGESAYRSGFSSHTWVGLALPFAVYSAAGVIFALVGKERKGGWVLILAGLVAGIVANWFCFHFAMKRLNPFVLLYAPDGLIAISNLLYGVALASYPRFARKLAAISDQNITG